MSTLRPMSRPWTVLVAAVSLMTGPLLAGASAQTLAPGASAPTPDLTGPMITGAPGPLTQPPAVTPVPDPPLATISDLLRRELSQGDMIWVVHTAGDPVRGRVVRIGATDLEIRAETSQAGGGKRRLNLAIPLGTIESLERPRDSSRNGALIGAGVGAGVGIAMFAHAAAIDANEMDEWASGYVVAGALFTGIGALVGWAIDAVHSKPAFRYTRVSGVAGRVRLVPLPSRGLGMAIGVSF